MSDTFLHYYLIHLCLYDNRSLFSDVNQFKNDNFCEEDEEAKEEHRQECEKRKIRTMKDEEIMHSKATLYPSIYVQPPSPDNVTTPSTGSTGSEMSW